MRNDHANASAETRATGVTARATESRAKVVRFQVAARTQNEPAQPGDTGGSNEQMGMDDLRQAAGAIAEAIMADFANRMSDAKRRMSPAELAATLKALQQARSAALAAASRNAAMSIQGRRRMAMDNRAGHRRKVQGFAR